MRYVISKLNVFKAGVPIRILNLNYVIIYCILIACVLPKTHFTNLNFTKIIKNTSIQKIISV